MPHDLMLYLVIGAFVLLGIFSRQTAGNDQARLTRLEAKVNLLLDKLGVAHDTPSAEVRGYILEGKKINAIKAYREQHPGIGLKEAKDMVDAVEEQMKAGNYR